MKEWLIHFPLATQSKPKVRLICFPFAGGGTTNYFKWRKDLDTDIDLYAINLPGRERFYSKPFLTNYEELIIQLASIFANDQNELPMIFFGHSYGGLTAYLIALELQNLKKLHNTSICNPIHLFISARLAPETNPNHLDENLASLSYEKFLEVIIERYQGIPRVILDDPAMLNIFMPIIQNDFKMYEQNPYVLQRYEDQMAPCDITTIGYSEDNTAIADLLKWKNFTKKSYDHVQLSGGHMEIVNNWQPVTVHINQIVKNLVN